MNAPRHSDMPTGLRIDPLAAKLMQQAIFVTGAGRTGTTITGQLVHSLEGVEYSFEPPVTFGLLALIDSLPEEAWKLLFELYLFEDLFVEAMSGRRLTFNPRDTSYIYRVKTRDEIEQRFVAPRRRTEFFQLLERQRLACKITDLVPRLSQVAKWYVAAKFVVLVRNPMDVVSSIIDRGWFSDRTLTGTPAIWPFYRVGKYQIPFWLKPDDRREWLGLNEVNRCLFYFNAMYAEITVAENVRVIDYGRLVRDPQREFGALIRWLDAARGPYTAKILDGVKPQERACNAARPADADKSLLARAGDIYAAWQAVAAQQATP